MFDKINILKVQEKFQKAVPLGAAERKACSGAEWDWLVRCKATHGFEISFK